MEENQHNCAQLILSAGSLRVITDIAIRLEIPFSPNEHDFSFPQFSHWLPLEEDQVLIADRDGIMVRLWFAPDCLLGSERSALERGGQAELEKWVNIRVHKIYADVALKGISDELAQFIYENRDWPRRGPDSIPADDLSERLKEEYVKLGQQVLEAVVGAVNRFISYFRVHGGQYWLRQRQLDYDRMRSDFTEFRARARIEAQDWFNFEPPSTDTLRVHMGGEERYVPIEDWPQVAEFVQGRSRPDLVLELLTNSELLQDEGYRRSAITEGVAALEAATSRFSESPKLNDLRGTELARRMDTPRLRSQVEHMGFSGTWRYLVPLLFGAEVLPSDLLDRCQRVIEIRNNIMHGGQRDVNEATLRPLLHAVRKTCTILARFTDD